MGKSLVSVLFFCLTVYSLNVFKGSIYILLVWVLLKLNAITLKWSSTITHDWMYCQFTSTYIGFISVFLAIVDMQSMMFI